MKIYKKSLCKCPNCGNKFHGYMHKRSYDVGSLRKYFAGFKLLNLLLFDWQNDYWNSILLRIRQDLCGSYWYHPKAICPGCGYKFSSREPPSLPIMNKIVSVICTGTNLILSGMVRLFNQNSPTSIIVLMKKQNDFYSGKRDMR